MSFMFNPHPFDAPTPVNRPPLPDSAARSVVAGAHAAALRLSGELRSTGRKALALDGYPGAQWEQIVGLIVQDLTKNGVATTVLRAADAYKAPEILEKELSPHLPTDRIEDPVLLYGKLMDGGFGRIFDPERLDRLCRTIQERKESREGRGAILVYGCGCATRRVRELCDVTVYLDVTPKEAILRARAGLYANLGDRYPRPIREMLRRCYYVDFEAAGALRRELLVEGAIDWYASSGDAGGMVLVPREALDAILSALARTPFRCKPIYLEGVWGGTYMKRLRNLPESMRNCAWAFDLIPLEVSILVQVGPHLLDVPFFTFVQKEGEAIMGRPAVERFGGYFPIRFNYDDTFHSGGNMSIQVHPDGEYCTRTFGELGRQDESYYVVATGHGAKTYLGFHDGADAKGFLAAARRSETKGTPVDHDRFVHSHPSRPGTQFLIPAGTIHASGRNQVVLEIGSLTVGSYTFKLYDYLRKDLDGTPRPIHTFHGEKVLRQERTAQWVRPNLVPEPRRVRAGEGWAEYVVGEHDLLYFSLRRLEFETACEDDTAGAFHVLVLVDGELVVVESLSDPSMCYRQGFLDIVVVPASLGRYRIRNLGKQPVVVHKTLLKQGFHGA